MDFCPKRKRPFSENFQKIWKFVNKSALKKDFLGQKIVHARHSKPQKRRGKFFFTEKITWGLDANLERNETRKALIFTLNRKNPTKRQLWGIFSLSKKLSNWTSHFKILANLEYFSVKQPVFGILLTEIFNSDAYHFYNLFIMKIFQLNISYLGFSNLKKTFAA